MQNRLTQARLHVTALEQLVGGLPRTESPVHLSCLSKVCLGCWAGQLQRFLRAKARGPIGF